MFEPLFRRASLVGITLACCSRGAPAQDRLWTVSGGSYYDYLGQLGVQAVGDLNGDGVPEVIANLTRILTRCLDGATGAKLFDYAYGNGLPYETLIPVRIGDLDGDGVDDLLVPVFQSTGAGKFIVAALSGSTRAELYHLDGRNPLPVGDVDGDGADDFVVQDFDFVNFTSVIRLHSGASGATLLTIAPVGRSIGQGFGMATALAGDWNRDGVPDLAITDAPPPNGIASVLIASLKDGSILATTPVTIPLGSIYSPLIDAAGDLDQDGFVDFLAINLYEDVGALTQAGVVRILSGATLTENGRIEGENAYDGLDVNGMCGDVDGDGFEDFSLTTGDFQSYRTASWIHSGRLRSRLYAVQSLHPGDWYLHLSGADLDGDGLSDIVSGHGFDLPGIGGGYLGTVAVDRGRRAFLSLTPAFQRRYYPFPPSGQFLGWLLSCTATLADFQPDSAVTIVLSELDGAPMSHVMARVTVDGVGSADAKVEFLVNDHLSHTLGMQAVGIAANGQAITTAIERVQFN